MRILASAIARVVWLQTKLVAVRMLGALWIASAETPAAQLISMKQELLATEPAIPVKIAPQIRIVPPILIASSIPANLKESVSTLGCVLQPRKICATTRMKPFLEMATKEPNVAPLPAAVSELKLESKLPAPVAQTVVAAWGMTSLVKTSIRSPFASLVNA